MADRPQNSAWPRPSRKTIRMAIVLGLLLVIGGCMSRQQVVYQEMAAPKSEIAPRTIAILPFRDQTATPGLDRLVRERLYGHLSPRHFRDVELSIVDQALTGAHDSPFDRLTPENLRDLGNRLGCDAIVAGRITEFERLFMGIYSQLSVGADIVIYATHDGRAIWSDNYVARLHDGSVPLTPLGIPLSGARTGWNLRDSQIIRAVDDLTRTLAGRIPAPDAPEALASTYQYELQVGAYLDHQLALDQRHVLKSMGYPATVRTELHQKSIWHRVMVGPYGDENRALQVRQKLEGLLDTRPFLRRRQ